MSALALILLAVLLCDGAYGAPAASNATLAWGDCPSLSGVTSAAAMDCGWLVTGARLHGERVRLRVVLLRARPDRHDAAPVIFIPGGPGDSAGLGAARLARWQTWQQQAGWPHGIVLFDPRGTGESRPRVRCDTPIAVPYRRRGTAGAVDTLDEDTQAMPRCLAHLGADTMTRLGARAQLRDLEALVDSLGVDRVSLWAISYGTRIAQLFAQRHPGRVARVVLDSVVPFSHNAFLAVPRQMAAAVDRLDAACGPAGAHCASQRPRRVLAALLARYGQAPVGVSVAAYPKISGRVEVTPYRLLIMILLASYDSGHEADTVARLERALHGDSAALAPLAARLAALDADRARSDAVFWSTRCALASLRGDGDWRRILADVPLIAPYLAPALAASPCTHWPGARIPEAARGGLFEMPVLVVAGRDDVATPPAWARAFAARHARARMVSIAGAAHAPTLSNACAQRAVAQFMRDPEGPRPRCARPRPAQSGR